MKIKTKHDRRERIGLRIRKRVRGSDDRPRLSVFRSLAHIYVQAIDDGTGRTIASASSVEPSVKGAVDGAVKGTVQGGNAAGASVVGRVIAERLMAKGMKRAVFDRNGFLYHGRIRAIADAARKAGLEF